ncbi:hypothetical protein [Micromonospora globbae]|uniref:hypothetical protein n=1 Tax=Micromonospora globbae TaxID=1894969 RepID=UPI00343CB661
MSEWGMMEVPRDEPPSAGEQVCLALGASFLAGAVALFMADMATPWDAPLGLYPILACLAIGGCCGWQVGAGRRELRESRREHQEQMRALIVEVRALRRQVAGARPAGHLYLSHAVGQSDVGIRPTVVDAATDPALQRAREDGIEQGFDIGIRAQLADMGVTPLRPRKARRLTGDS